MIWGGIHDLKTGKPVYDAYFPRNVLPPDHPLLRLDFNRADISEAALSGVIVSGRGPMLVASRPILKTGNQGPARGCLIMGKFLTKDLAMMLSDQTRVRFTVTNDAESTGIVMKNTPNTLEDGLPYAIEYKSRDSLDAMAAYPDITGKPAFLIRSIIKRDVIKRGYETMRYALATFIMRGLALAVVVLIMMERTVVHPIIHLTRHILSINETGNFSLRLSVRRRDEIGTLAREFDRMLEKIEVMNRIMEHINDQLIEDINKRQQIEDKLNEANK